jgi:hypothetical protein
MRQQQYEASVAEARRQERERTERERRARQEFRDSRAKLLQKDNASRLAQIQNYMDRTADSIVSRATVALPKDSRGHSTEVNAIFGSK